MNGFSVNNKNIYTPEELLNKGLSDAVRAEYAFFTSFDGMSLSGLYDILCALPGGNRLILNGHFDAFCGAKNALRDTDILLSGLTMKKVHTVCIKGSFHPKIYLLKYSDPENKKCSWRLITGSKNITKDSFLDAFVMFEGDESQGGVTEKDLNGNELYDIISPYFDYVKSSIPDELKALKKVGFKLFSQPEGTECKKIQFLLPKKHNNLLDNILNNTEDAPVYIISPFVSGAGAGKNAVLFSRKEELDRIKPELLPGSVYFYNNPILSKNGDDKKDSDKKYMELHGKVYIKKEADNTVLYIGSANFTHSAFHVNEEILAVITFSGCEVYDKLTLELNEDIRSGIWSRYPGETSDKTGSDSRHTDMAAVSGIYEYISRSLELDTVNTEDWTYTYKTLEYKDVEFKSITPVSGVSQNGVVLFEFQGDEYRYAFNAAELLKVYDENEGTEVYSKFNDALNKKINEELKRQKQDVFRLKGSYRLQNRRKKENSGKSMPEYEKTADTGMYELIKSLVIKYSYISDEKERKAAVCRELRNILSRIIEITEEEQKFIDFILENKRGNSNE